MIRRQVERSTQVEVLIQSRQRPAGSEGWATIGHWPTREQALLERDRHHSNYGAEFRYRLVTTQTIRTTEEVGDR